MSPRARTGVVAAGVLVAAGAVLWLTTVFGPPPRVTAPPLDELAPHARTADDFARLSCVHVRLASQFIQASAAAATVRTQLASARALAAEALRRDGRFAALSGGVASLDEAIRNDDAADAEVALPVMLEQCEAVPSLR